ncbi:T9SS type B sorting domain-containing protein [Flavobacterium sp. 83]|uniref:T9SS type B sorting domain-containing protein n=1 Tax=Flavobacterium sp. 83 TaxID=1131812 RepID=UPI00068B317F|nr:T9SS type B sorting domain-containing protein [Flavobacterium sp. 83]
MDVGYLGSVYTYTVPNVPSGETVVITVTPTGTPADCFGPNSISCVLDACLISPTLSVTQGASSQQICENETISDIIFTIDGGATTAALTLGSLPTGVTTSLVGNQFTIKGIATNTGIFNYTISTSGGCGTNASISGIITVNSITTPTFAAVPSICEGEFLAALPLQSNNGIIGTWSPALNNITTTEYTFTPNSGQCATKTKLIITVNPVTIPSFTTVTPICEGTVLAPLPIKSNNNIIGSWSPALNNITTTEYTFTPNSGQCATKTKLIITVNSGTIPSFTAVAPICEGTVLAPLPIKSNNNIIGSWSPALNNITTTEYIFTPNSGQCATTTKLTITVNPVTIPSFTAVNPICAGTVLSPLPIKSNNNIIGTWSPAINNVATTEYTFTPNSGQCATTTKLTITVNPIIIPTFTVIAPICAGTVLSPLPIKSNNNIEGTWSPALNKVATTEYTFTPNIGQCANSYKLTITVNPIIIPTFTVIAPICEGTLLLPLPIISNNNITGSWSPALNNVTTTEYTFTPDSGQCANSFKLTITVNPKPIPLLNNGIICIDKNTNTIIQSYILDSKLNAANYNFDWFLNGNKISNAIGNTLEATEKGIYAVIATNKITNCSSTLVQATVTEIFSNSTTIEIKQTNAFSNAATVTISIVQGIGKYEYQLDQGQFQSSNIFSDVPAGTHIINVIDTNGCTDLSQEITIVGYQKFFTPNGDGHNDTWNIIGFNRQSNAIIYIFDRYGKLLKQINSNDFGWDGTYNGYQMPATDYWFKVIYVEDGINKEFKSHFSLKR